MVINYNEEERILHIKLTEEIDHHTTEVIRRRSDYEIQKYIPEKVIFDFKTVTFMDSAGIGLIIGRYKLISMLGGMLEIENVSSSVEKILKMSGLLKIIKICVTES